VQRETSSKIREIAALPRNFPYLRKNDKIISKICKKAVVFSKICKKTVYKT
jgi:hypothetical protein